MSNSFGHPEVVKIGDQGLRESAQHIYHKDDSLLQLIDKMRRIMNEAGGIGIAANQIGDSRSVFIAKFSAGETVCVNPALRLLKGTKKLEEPFEEGCLSVPGISCVHKNRYEKVELRYTHPDNFSHEIVVELTGLDAIIAQHEMDHLCGSLYLDRLSPMKREMALKRYNKIRLASELYRNDLTQTEK